MISVHLGTVISLDVTSYDNTSYSTTEMMVQKKVPLSQSPYASFVLDSNGKFPSYEQPNLFIVYLDPHSTVIYFCKQLESGMKKDGAWILTREQNPSLFTLKRLEWKVRDFGIFLEFFRVDQRNCPRFLQAKEVKLVPVAKTMCPKKTTLEEILS